jgi:anti-sigma regulatory factor (Ser/Thr protein kinase)
MDNQNPYVIKMRFPSDLDYIPPVRKFVADTLQVNHFSPKFAYRSEVIVDEICHNAIAHGSRTMDATVEIDCKIFPDRFEFQANDQGGNKDDLERLKKAVKKADAKSNKNYLDKEENQGLGLEIVRLLSEDVKLEISKDNMTTVRIVRKREDI